MKTVHVVGNSHVMYFVGQNVPIDDSVTRVERDLTIRAYKAGDTGATVYGLMNPNSKTQAGKKISEFLSAEQAKNVVFVLGDVDFREHMLKHLTHGMGSVEWYLEEVSKKYEQYIRSIDAGYNISITSMVPFAESYYRFKMGEDLRNAALWFLVDSFNTMLFRLAINNGWGFVSLRNLVDGRGFLREEFVMNPIEVHAEPRKVFPFVIEQLEALYGQS